MKFLGLRWCLLGVVMVVSFMCVASDVSISRARARIGKITGQATSQAQEGSDVARQNQDQPSVRADKRLNRIAGQLKPEGVAGTADFLKNPEYCQVIRQNWGDYLAQFGDTTIKQMLANEERYKKDYFVFYHAQKAENRLMVEFLNNLYAFINKKPLRSDFEYLRFWKYGSGLADVNSYLNNFEVRGGGDLEDSFSDLTPEVSAVLLSANPTLFSNFTSDSECTFAHFINATDGVGHSSTERVLQGLFQKYSFNMSYIKKLLAISDRFKTQTGDIIQLFIPKALVNAYVYLSRSGGRPIKELIMDKAGNPLALQDYDNVRKRYVKADGILNLIQNNIDVFKDVQDIQVRLFFAQSGPLLEPQLGAKMFRFTTLTPEAVQEYKKSVLQVSQKIFSGRSVSVKKSAAVDDSQQLSAVQEQEVKEALGRLTVPTTILEAVRYPSALSLIKGLVEQGASLIDEKNSHGRTALMIAASVGALDVVQYLVSQGANIEAVDSTRKTALMIAASVGALDVVRYLVSVGAGVDRVGGRGTALIYAAGYGQLDVVRYLVSVGADINKVASDRNTALMSAAVGIFPGQDLDCNENNFSLKIMPARFEVVKWLVEHGVELGNILLSSIRGKEIESYLHDVEKRGKGAKKKVKPAVKTKSKL